MQVKPDARRALVYQLRLVDGAPVRDYAGTLRQTEDGGIIVEGLWSDLVQAPDDIRIQASKLGLSPLEWSVEMVRQSSLVRVEVIE